LYEFSFINRPLYCANMTQLPDVAAHKRRVELWMETGAVMLVCVAPALFGSTASTYPNYTPVHYSFEYSALYGIVRSIGTIAIVLFVIWRSTESFDRFGLRRFRIGRDLFGGIGIWVIVYGVYRVCIVVLPIVLGSAYLTGHSHKLQYDLPSSPMDLLLLVVMSAAVGTAEELLFRAYLITRLEELIESTPVALFVTTVIFALCHGAYGAYGVIVVGAGGLVQGAAFCVFRRFAPVAISHAIQDVYAIIARMH
jgi:membrane protease YdiL (CAAX protease family)